MDQTQIDEFFSKAAEANVTQEVESPDVGEALTKEVSFGKHKGSTFGEVLTNPGGVKYLEWITSWEKSRRDQRLAAETILQGYGKWQKARKKDRASPLKKEPTKGATSK